MAIRLPFTDQTSSLWQQEAKHSQGKDWIIWVCHNLLSCWDEGANHNFGQNLCHVGLLGFFLLSILTGTHVLCWSNQCHSLTWRGKGVYFRLSARFFSGSVPPMMPLHVHFFRHSIFPLKSSTAPPVLVMEVSLMPAIRLSATTLSVVRTLLSAFYSSECLAADTIQGCFFPSRIAWRLLPCTL